MKGSTTIIDTSYNWKHIPEKDTMVVDSSDYRKDTSKVKIHESKFLVKDAEVFISDGKEMYELKPIRIRNRFYPGQENTSFSKFFIFPEEETVIYTDTTNRFQPQPNTEYYLTVKTDSLGKLTGTVKTPSEIYFTNKSGIEDTLIYNNSYTLKWNNVRTGNLQLKIGTRWHAREIEINRKDSSYKFLVESSRHQFLTIRNMEENYYKYFHSEDSEEISNIMIGRTVVAKSCGVKGGYGVFGALDFDQIKVDVVQ